MATAGEGTAGHFAGEMLIAIARIEPVVTHYGFRRNLSSPRSLRGLSETDKVSSVSLSVGALTPFEDKPYQFAS
jgi:hypothetical protein